MKYLPEWMGKLIIKITPTYRNIIVAPVISEDVLGCYKEIQEAMDTENNKMMAKKSLTWVTINSIRKCEINLLSLRQ